MIIDPQYTTWGKLAVDIKKLLDRHLLVRIKRRLLTVCLGNLGPQLLGTLAAAITDVKRNDLSRFDIHCQPNLLLVLLLLDKARHLVGFDLQTLNHDIVVARDRLDIAMIRQRLKAIDDKAQEPLEPYPHRTADPP